MQTLTPTWNLSNTATAKWYVRLFPSLTDVAFLLPLIVLFAKMSGTQLLFSDGDTGWHIRTGEWILAQHAVPRTDLFSFTKSNAPWFAWEWAWDVAFAAIHRVAGLSGVGFATTLILGFFTVLVYRLAVRVSHNHLIAVGVTVLTAAVSSIHWLARPHLFSWIFTLLFLNVIESAKSGRPKLLYVLPVLMTLWVNIHGGFVAGIMILGCYAAGESLTAAIASESSDFRQLLAAAWKSSQNYWQSLALCAAATLINPYGWQLHKHIYTYLTDAELLDKIQEFQSISFHAGPAILFEIMLVLAAFAAFRKLQARDFSPVLLLCVWAHYALLSARHIPIFMAVAAPFAASLLADSLQAARSIPLLAKFARSVSEISHDLSNMETGQRLHMISAAGLLIIAALFAAGQEPFAPQFNKENFPAQAMPVLDRRPVSAKVFTTDQWADFLLYKRYPAQRVFFDGRSDFYGNDFIKVNQRIASAEHDWKALLMQFGINLVLVKPEMPIAAALKLTPGAQVLFDDGKAIVFDINGIYRFLPGSGDTVKRTASSSQILQLVPRGVVSTLNHSTNLQKGTMS